MTLSGLYTIPRCHPFLASLARGLLTAFDGQPPEALATATIYLPSRRALRALQGEFLQHTGHDKTRALLLPRLVTFGDIDADELLLSGPGLHETIGNLPPVIPSLERQWVLSDFLCSKNPELTREQALKQADELARLLDQLQIYEKTETDLREMVSHEELAQHWEDTLKFLEIVTHYWPQHLAEKNKSDPAQYRNIVLRAQAQLWRDKPPAGPVIIAGVARSEPALLELLQAALKLPQGIVVLPGFDRDMSAEAWAGLDSVHADYLLKELMEHLPATRSDVALWPAVMAEADAHCAPRSAWLREAMIPATATAGWQRLQQEKFGSDVLQNIELITCATEQEEAKSIALIIRAALEEKDEPTISLVTPDRNLARLVAGQLQRWHIHADDSAGVPLHRLPLGIFLLGIVAACGTEASVFDGLALAKHPLLQMGMPTGAAHEKFRDMERLVLRQAYVGPTLAAWQRAIADETIRLDDDQRAVLAAHLQDWLAIMQPLLDLLATPTRKVRLLDMVEAHLQVAETLAATENETGADILWADEAGNCAAQFFYEARTTLGNMEIMAGDYGELLQNWLAPLNVRVPYGQHPRVTIHGTIETRLQQSDIMILAGLNEGTWPATPPASPFLSRRMMGDLGLPDPETLLAQAAHDFVASASAPRVYLTRAARVGGTPSVPARWLLRMQTVLTDPAVAAQWQQGGKAWPELARQLDRPEKPIASLPAPAPTPAREHRPRKLSVTQVERWLQDPYGLYAQKILNLRQLAPLQLFPDERQRGQLVHSILEEFTKATLGKKRIAPRDVEALKKSAYAALGRYAEQPDIAAMWQAYLDIVIDWLVDVENAHRLTYVPAAAEIGGGATFNFASGNFTLTARADRIDRDNHGRLAIIDYKTGTAPNASMMVRGAAAQLSLETLIATSGGFADLGRDVAGVAYWKTPSRQDSGDIVDVADDRLSTIVGSARLALESMADAYDDAAVPYLPVPLPDRQPRHNDYAHLERILEWAFADDAGDEGGEAAYG